MFSAQSASRGNGTASRQEAGRTGQAYRSVVWVDLGLKGNIRTNSSGTAVKLQTQTVSGMVANFTMDSTVIENEIIQTYFCLLLC